MVKTPFSNLIAKSPFKALQEHVRVVAETAREVPPLFEALSTGDQGAVNTIKEKIFEHEAAADAIKNQLRTHLPKSLFLPVDRRDLLEVLQLQDSIADSAQDIAGLLVERPMELPEPLREPLLSLTRRCVDAVEQCVKIVEELDELIEMGFKGREANRVEEMVGELNQIEDETDDMGLKLTHTLFEHEDDMKPVSVMMWYQMIQWVGDLADYAEKVGDRLRLLIAR